MIPARSTTDRGFVIYDEFTDTYGHEVRVQESSLATDTRVWVFASDGSAHLDIAQASRVRDALDTFIREAQAAEEAPA